MYYIECTIECTESFFSARYQRSLYELSLTSAVCAANVSKFARDQQELDRRAQADRIDMLDTGLLF